MLTLRQMYMSEVDSGLLMLDYFPAKFGSKLHDVSTMRDVLLKGAKVKGEDAMKMGIVDAAYDSEERLCDDTMRLGEKSGSRKWYKEIRKSLFPDSCNVLGEVNPKL